MDYAQLNEDGSFWRQIKTTGNVEWSATHFCPPAYLTPEESALFRVVPFHDTPKPEHDRITHTAERDGGELVDGQWQTKWVVIALPLEVAAANAAAVAQEAGQLRDVESAKSYAKLQALRNMTPAQVSTWVDGNVTNLAQAQDAIKTLAVAVCVLARRL